MIRQMGDSPERVSHQAPLLTARRDRVRLPNGVINDEYYVLEYPDWVNVIAITKEGDFLMERQYGTVCNGRVMNFVPECARLVKIRWNLLAASFMKKQVMPEGIG